MKRINILESQFILFEGKLHDQAKKRTYQVLKNGNTWLSGVIDNPCTEDGVDGSMTYFDWVFRDLSSHWCRNNIKLTPVIANILYNELGYRGVQPMVNEINTFREIVPLFEKDPKLGAMPWNEAIKLSYENLYEYFKPIIEQGEQNITNKINSEKFNGKSNYLIKLIKNQEEGDRNYAGFTGGANAEGHHICYLTSQATWNTYTNNNKNNVYVCLRNGYEHIHPYAGENAPFDDYGLSMIFVIVDGKGRLTTSNVRWNHAYVDDWNRKHRDQEPREVDKILNAYEISKIINLNFNETFTGKYIIPMDELVNKIKEANDIYEIKDYFDECPKIISFGIYIVQFGGKYNLLDMHNKRFILDNFYEKISDVGFGIASITEGNKTNLFDVKNGKPLLKSSITNIEFVRVYDGGKNAVCKYINDSNNLQYLFDVQNRRIVRNEGYNYVEQIHNGIAITKGGYDVFYSMIDMNTGEEIGKQQYQKLNWVSHDGIILLTMYGKYLIYNPEKKTFLNEEGYDKICYNKKELANECLFDKVVNGYNGGRYVLVKKGYLTYAQFNDGRLLSITNPYVCGYEKHHEYEELAQELDKFMKEPPYPFHHKNYVEGLYDYWKDRSFTDGLFEIADDYVDSEFGRVEDEELRDEYLTTTIEAARILAHNYHYIFDEMRNEEEWEEENDNN